MYINILRSLLDRLKAARLEGATRATSHHSLVCGTEKAPMHIYIHVHLIYLHVYIYIYIYICVYKYICICMYVCKFIYIYIAWKQRASKGATRATSRHSLVQGYLAHQKSLLLGTYI